MRRQGEEVQTWEHVNRFEHLLSQTLFDSEQSSERNALTNFAEQFSRSLRLLCAAWGQLRGAFPACQAWSRLSWCVVVARRGCVSLFSASMPPLPAMHPRRHGLGPELLQAGLFAAIHRWSAVSVAGDCTKNGGTAHQRGGRPRCLATLS